MKGRISAKAAAGHVGTCPVHGKRLYASRKAAKAVIRRSADPMREYPCTEVPGHWHVGHLPLRVMTGDCTASEWYGEAS